MPRRSVLFSPGDQARKLEGALDSSADVVVFDLEDAVAPSDKEAARSVVTEVLTGVDDATHPEVLVRLNPVGGGCREDLNALAAAEVGGAIDGFVLPKVGDAGDVYHVRGLSREAGLSLANWCLIESAAGVLSAAEIAAVDRVSALIFGGEDYAASVGAERTESNKELLFPRQRVVAAAASVGVDAIDGISTELEDMDVVHAEATEARTFGFDGKLAIHPAQIEAIHAAFEPDPEQVAWAERVLEAAETAEGGVFRLDDQMIDEPLIERARQIRDRAG